MKKKEKAPYGYSSSFARNLHERTDFPVFTAEEAVKQIKRRKFNEDSSHEYSAFQKEMDNFFLLHLPEDILSLAEFDNNDLNKRETMGQ